MKRLFLTLFILFTLVTFSTSQIKRIGRIKVIEERGISELVAPTELNISGYRIQIFTGGASDRAKAQSIKAYIEENYGTNAYIDYESPLFKVRVGDFPTKLEATALKYKLKKEYSNAYLVKVKKINL